MIRPVPFIWQYHYEIESEPFWHDWQTRFLNPTPSNITFEQRFFWSMEVPIVLTGLSLQETYLAAFDLDLKKDGYLLLAEKNIKLRKSKLHYKPIAYKKNNCMGFEAKKKYHILKQQAAIAKLLKRDDFPTESTKPSMKAWLREEFTIVDIYKESLRLNVLPEIQASLEFSRLKIKNKIFHSLVVESLSEAFVSNAVEALGITQKPMDYVCFLKECGC